MSLDSARLGLGDKRRVAWAGHQTFKFSGLLLAIDWILRESIAGEFLEVLRDTPGICSVK